MAFEMLCSKRSAVAKQRIKLFAFKQIRCMLCGLLFENVGGITSFSSEMVSMLLGQLCCDAILGLFEISQRLRFQ